MKKRFCLIHAYTSTAGTAAIGDTGGGPLLCIATEQIFGFTPPLKKKKTVVEHEGNVLSNLALRQSSRSICEHF